MATEHNESSPDTADSGSDSVSDGPGPSPAKKKSNLYFSKKQYVRNDKYTLASMLGNKDIE